MKKILTALLLILVLVAFSVFALGSGSSDEGPEIVENEEVSDVEKDKETDEETQKDESDNVCRVGQTAKAKSYNLSVDEVNILESDNMFSQPDEGNVYVEVVMTMENTSDSELNVSSLLYFESYVDGYVVSEDYLARAVTSNGTMDGAIAPGKKLKGSLCYQVPADWSEIEIQIDLGFSSNNEVTVLIENE